MNIAIVSGNLGGSAKTSKFSNGNTKYEFSVATNGGYTDSEGKWVDQTEWHKVETIVSAKATEKLHNYYRNGLVKGAKVSVNGMNRTSKWQDSEGVDQYKRFISVEYSNGGKIEIVGLNPNGQGAPIENTADDVPF